MKIVFASNNTFKFEEIKSILGNKFKVLSLKEISCFDQIPEEQPTIEGNASQKAWYIYNKYNCNCFADDTGLEIEELNGEPGVYSARYAGENCDFQDNIKKVLLKLAGKTNRNAKFKTVISLVIDGKEKLFSGIVEGTITKAQQGNNGFGYDPLFIPKGYTKTFAEMSSELKNSISHRAQATNELVKFLENLNRSEFV